jgi:hypothetical protein
MSVVMQKILGMSLSSKMNLAFLPTLKDIHNRQIYREEVDASDVFIAE